MAVFVLTGRDDEMQEKNTSHQKPPTSDTNGTPPCHQARGVHRWNLRNGPKSASASQAMLSELRAWQKFFHIGSCRWLETKSNSLTCDKVDDRVLVSIKM